ncbi:MAG: Hsp33 family molecular chaperone HslO, partial [Bacteroidota bacterium]
MPDIKTKFINRDRFTRLMTKDGMFRATFLKNSVTVLNAQQKHNLPPQAAYFLALALSSVTLTASFFKGEERAILDFSGDGLITKIYTEAVHAGEARGYINFDDRITVFGVDEIQSENLFGYGTLRVSKIFYDKTEPVTGIVDISNGTIVDDLELYYSQSEQIPTKILLTVSFDENGMIKTSGGFILQAMPGSSHSQFETMVHTLKENFDLLKAIESGVTPEEILNKTLNTEFTVIKTTPVDFFCRCTKTGFMNKLLTLGPDEIKGMKSDGNREIVCHFCNKKYHLEDKDFDYL